jgi:lysine-N-methylase
MAMPVRHLPVVQNWDCHVCGTCCQEYLVTVSDEERQRIEAQDWTGDPVVDGRPLFSKTGPWWDRRYHLNHREDGSCVFLSPQGRCRIHERFGYETKPLPCRLFPFVLVPAGDHWRVGMRFACPSAAANKGRNARDHEEALRLFAAELAEREGLDKEPGKNALRPPYIQAGLRLDWPDVLRLMRSLLTILHNPQDRIERRLRKCVTLATLCRQAKLDDIRGKRLEEFLNLLVGTLEGEVPADPASLPPPNWVGRILFRQAAALFTRKDHGPNQGIARRGRIALFGAAWRFARGQGPVPRLHKHLPETTFAQIEAGSGVLPPDVETLLERYYTTKVEALQFCGAPNFRLPFWEGLDMLALTLPVLLWVMRAQPAVPPLEAMQRALTIVDDHFGYNKVLGTMRQRFSFRILSRTGELAKLIAWYSR